MIVSKDPRRIKKRTFLCPECGAVVTAPKMRGKTNAGHNKTMWCYVCKNIRIFTQEDNHVRTLAETYEQLEGKVDKLIEAQASANQRLLALEAETFECGQRGVNDVDTKTD